jgi:hypothetical protein
MVRLVFFVTSHSLQTNCRFSLIEVLASATRAQSYYCRAGCFLPPIRKKRLAASRSRQPDRAKCVPDPRLLVPVALDLISETLLRASLVASLVVPRPLLDFFLADTGQRVEQAMFWRRRIRAATSCTCTAFVAEFAHTSPFASCFRFVRISRLCHPASPSPLLRARLAFNLSTVEPATFCHRLETFLDGMSPPFTTASTDTPAVVTLNSKNHVAHHLSATGQHLGFDQRRY